MNGGTLAASVLRAQGVKTLFTLCGGHISPLLVASRQAGIRIIDTRHEATAVFAADADARLSGRPGVAAVTAGPGITNSITAIRNAGLAQSPVILLGGAAPTLLKGRGALQDIDQVTLMKPNVKWVGVVRKRRQIVPVLELAFRACMEGVPGPVFVELPLDLLFDADLVKSWYAAGAGKGHSLKSRFTSWYINRYVKDMLAPGHDTASDAPTLASNNSLPSASVEPLHQQLLKSKRPVIVAGSGTVANAVLSERIAAALTTLGIPVYLSGMARGLLGANHTLQFRHVRKQALKEADTVLLLGVPNDFRLDYGRQIARTAWVGAINRSASDLRKNRTPQWSLHADPGNALLALASLGATPAKAEWMETLRQRELAREQEILQQAATKGKGINPLALLLALRAHMSEDAAVVADGGDFVATASYVLRPGRPLHWLDPGAFGTLGVGGGFALAAGHRYPGAETYLLYGDGSAGYSLMELDSFSRHRLPVIVIIGNDAGWTQIARDQIALLKDDCATVLDHSDYHEVARAFGAQGRRVETMEEFASALEEARSSFREGASFVINAILAPSEFRKGSLSM